MQYIHIIDMMKFWYMIQHAWMNLEKMLSERYHQERPRIISFRLYEMSKIGYVYIDKKKISDGL